MRSCKGCASKVQRLKSRCLHDVLPIRRCKHHACQSEMLQLSTVWCEQRLDGLRADVGVTCIKGHKLWPTPLTELVCQRGGIKCSRSQVQHLQPLQGCQHKQRVWCGKVCVGQAQGDRKSTRLNSSH